MKVIYTCIYIFIHINLILIHGKAYIYIHFSWHGCRGHTGVSCCCHMADKTKKKWPSKITAAIPNIKRHPTQSRYLWRFANIKSSRHDKKHVSFLLPQNACKKFWPQVRQLDAFHLSHDPIRKLQRKNTFFYTNQISRGESWTASWSQCDMLHRWQVTRLDAWKGKPPRPVLHCPEGSVKRSLVHCSASKLHLSIKRFHRDAI